MKVHILEIKFTHNGKDDALHPVILRDEKEMILVDCGYAGFLPLLENAVSLQKTSLQNLTGVIITHHDVDHVGALFELKQKYPAIKVYASAVEKNFINGKQKSLRLIQAESLFDCLPEEYKDGAIQFQQMLKAIRPVDVDQVFEENEEPIFLRDVQIISTPGHMPGHISLYLKDSKTLLAADAVVYENGVLDIANPQFTLDLPQAIASVRKLQNLSIQKMICYHGGLVENGIQEKLSDLVKKYSKHSEPIRFSNL